MFNRDKLGSLLAPLALREAHSLGAARHCVGDAIAIHRRTEVADEGAAFAIDKETVPPLTT
jgi:hypothetical protein